jgi:GNAT superfamily N-acetyltransferase
MRFIIRPMLEGDRERVSNLIKETFDSFDNPFDSEGLTFFSNYCNIDKNLVMEVKGEIIACHIFSLDKLSEKDIDSYQDKNGICGFLFCIHPNFQKKGLGSKFIQFEREHFKGRYDYIWGEADIRLNNYEFWKKNRDIIFETEKGFLSIMNL